MREEETELLRRADELAERCERSGIVTHSSFLTPAEVLLLRRAFVHRPQTHLLLHGGAEGCERCRAFFLPDWLTEEDFCREELPQLIRAVSIRSYFGTVGHRDYQGAILGLGLRRDTLGDIRVEGDTACVFCLPSAARLLLDGLDQVGRCKVRVSEIGLAELPQHRQQLRPVSFTVKSLRLDAVCGGMFGLSRSSAAELIRLGEVSLNYSVCQRVDAAVAEGDVISLHGRGKGIVSEQGGLSKKDRIFLTAQLYI